jgi:hypothetical protein
VVVLERYVAGLLHQQAYQAGCNAGETESDHPALHRVQEIISFRNSLKQSRHVKVLLEVFIHPRILMYLMAYPYFSSCCVSISSFFAILQFRPGVSSVLFEQQQWALQLLRRLTTSRSPPRIVPNPSSCLDSMMISEDEERREIQHVSISFPVHRE